MNMVQSVRELFGLVARDNGRETAVEIRPVLPAEWRPSGGDLVPLPGQRIERVINRVVRIDGNVTVFEQEVIYLDAPEPAPKPATFAERTPPGPAPKPDSEEMIILNRVWLYSYQAGAGTYFQYHDGSPVSGAGVDEIYRAAHEGRLIINNTIPQVPLRPHELELWRLASDGRRRRFGDSGVRFNDGRIVLQE